VRSPNLPDVIGRNLVDKNYKLRHVLGHSDAVMGICVGCQGDFSAARSCLAALRKLTETSLALFEHPSSLLSSRRQLREQRND
jgi:hypothetical protein